VDVYHCTRHSVGLGPETVPPLTGHGRAEREAAYTTVHTCVRCGSEFALVDDAVCVFHTGRVRSEHGPNRERRTVYDCCGRAQAAEGCATRYAVRCMCRRPQGS
jgi:hypothetical protein